MNYLILMLNLFGFLHSSRGTCDVYRNLGYALRGYNIRTGNPFNNNGDPGFKSQIFVGYKTDTHGKVSLNHGITAAGLSTCRRSMSSEAFSNVESYRNFMAKSSTSGWDLQIGTETKVTAGVKIKGIGISAEKKIPPAFTRAWSDSHGMKKLETFFSQNKGMVAVTQGVCTMYEVDLNSFHLPPFRADFKVSLAELQKGAILSGPQQIALFRKFISEYGTHFQVKTQLGAIFMHQTLYSEVARKKFSANTLQNCNDRTGTRIFGIQVEKDKKECSLSDENKLISLGSAHVQEYIITKGSKPTDIKDWAKQSFIPVPLRFQLSPIINLFTDEHIGAANIVVNGKKITNSLTIRKWFVPLYFDYCTALGIQKSCFPKKGCGYDDLCPIDTICTLGGSVHRCSEWTQWTCFESCTNNENRRQRRRRSCTGCSGKTSEERNAPNGACPPVPPCFKKFKTTKHNTDFDLDGKGNTVFLDRHHLKCQRGQALSGFRLQRNDIRNKIRWEYYCSTIQYPCSNIYSKNTLKKNNGRGNLVYLDRLSVQCNGNDLMLSQHYRRHGIESWCNFSCCRMKYPEQQQCHYHYTAKTYHNQKGSVVYLDRQNVRCPDDHSISSFHLQRVGKEHIKYKLKCCKTVPLSG